MCLLLVRATYVSITPEHYYYQQPSKAMGRSGTVQFRSICRNNNWEQNRSICALLSGGCLALQPPADGRVLLGDAGSPAHCRLLEIKYERTLRRSCDRMLWVLLLEQWHPASTSSANVTSPPATGGRCVHAASDSSIRSGPMVRKPHESVLWSNIISRRECALCSVKGEVHAETYYFHFEWRKGSRRSGLTPLTQHGVNSKHMAHMSCVLITVWVYFIPASQRHCKTLEGLVGSEFSVTGSQWQQHHRRQSGHKADLIKYKLDTFW